MDLDLYFQFHKIIVTPALEFELEFGLFFKVNTIGCWMFGSFWSRIQQIPAGLIQYFCLLVIFSKSVEMQKNTCMVLGSKQKLCAFLFSFSFLKNAMYVDILKFSLHTFTLPLQCHADRFGSSCPCSVTSASDICLHSRIREVIDIEPTSMDGCHQWGKYIQRSSVQDSGRSIDRNAFCVYLRILYHHVPTVAQRGQTNQQPLTGPFLFKQLLSDGH